MDDVKGGSSQLASQMNPEQDAEETKMGAWLLELGDLVQNLAVLLRRQRTAMARKDLRGLGQLLTQQEHVLERLNQMAASPEGERLLAPLHSGSSVGNPELASLYRRLLGDLIDLAAVNRANEHFLITARRAIQGAMYWHSGSDGRKRLTSYTRQGRLAV